MECATPLKLIKVVDKKTCFAKCQKDPKCAYIVFAKEGPPNSDNCGLVPKTGCNPHYSMDRGRWTILAQIPDKTFNHTFQQRIPDDFSIKSLGSEYMVEFFNGPEEDCAKLCLLTEGCNAFNYEGMGQMFCTMKKLKTKGTPIQCGMRHSETSVLDPSMLKSC